MNNTEMEKVSTDDDEDVDNDDESLNEGIQMKEIFVVTFIMGIWFYSLYSKYYRFHTGNHCTMGSIKISKKNLNCGNIFTVMSMYFKFCIIKF